MPPVDDPRSQLLQRLIDEVAVSGLADRSLRDIAEAAGSSHRMVLYHFGSRAGLISAIVEATEAAQRATLERLAEHAESAEELVVALWREVSSESLRPLVRLFFECVGITGGTGLTEPWLDVAKEITERVGEEYDADRIRLGVAVTRGLLIDVLASGSTVEADRALAAFTEMWRGSA